MPFRLYANCIAVRGARRGLICDLQRRRYYPVPLSLLDTLERHRDDDRDELYAGYPPEAHGVLDEYFAALTSEELGWWCDEPDRFPEMELTWDYPGRISNAIIDTGPESEHDYAELFRQLDDLGCRAVQLRFFAPVALARVDEILAGSDASGFRSLEVLLPFTDETDDERLGALMLRHPRVQSLFCHSAPERRLGEAPFLTATIAYHTDRVDSSAHCGQVHPAYFVVSLPLFTESQRHNSCLNRKVSVDEHGDIRNCPSMPGNYGNARDTSLHSAVARADFREVWDINKDQIDVCRDCEFRHICTDCRAFVRDSDDRYSKPSRCGYDPYTATWKSEPSPGQLTATAAMAAAAG